MPECKLDAEPVIGLFSSMADGILHNEAHRLKGASIADLASSSRHWSLQKWRAIVSTGLARPAMKWQQKVRHDSL